MIHLRVLVPASLAGRTLDLLCASPAVSSVVHLKGGAYKPAGDVILADVAREEASVIIDALRRLGVDREGTIAVEHVDTAISEAARAAERAAAGYPSDAVVWEEVEARTSESVELSGGFLVLMIVATVLAAIAIMTDSPVLLVGAMVVGPEFGPLAAFCVALVQRRGPLAKRSLTALAVGFPLASAVTLLATLVMKWTGIAPDDVGDLSRPVTQFISHPDWFSAIVAVLAGIVGMLSLTNAKSGALIGVLISVTTIPAAANIAVAVAYTEWDELFGAAQQLALNLALIVLGGVTTLLVQRRLFVVRRRRYLASDGAAQ